MILLILLTLLVVYIISYYLYVRRYPPGPPPLPLVGNLLQLSDKEFAAHVDELTKKYGPVFTLFMPYPTVMVTSYEAIKEAVVTKGEHFSGRLQLPPLSLFNNVPNSGVFMSVGDNWREQRRMALTILRDFGMGKSLMEEKVMNSVNEMVYQLGKLDDMSKVDVPRILQVCVGNTINEMLFGYTYSYDEAGIGKMMQYVELMHSFFVDMAAPEMLIIQAYPWAKNLPLLRGAYRRAKSNMEKYHAFIEREVTAQEESFSPDAASTTFVQAYLKEMYDSKNPFLNRDQLVSVATDFWAGGMETTSLTLMWAILFLMKWPDVQRKAQEEIAEVVGQDRFPAIADKPSMPYTSALMQEILRCANISTFEPHMATSDQTIDGKAVPSGAVVVPQYYTVLGNDADFDGPKEFRPERFLETDGQSVNKTTVTKNIPFGIGKRACPGEGLARMQLFLVLTALLQRFSFYPIGEVDLTPDVGTIKRPRWFSCRMESRL